jgi:uncharacterized protein YacL
MIKFKITLGKVLAALMIGLSVSGIASSIADNQQLALWQFNTLCWAIVAVMIELRLDKAEREYNELVDIIFTSYEEQKNTEEVKEDAE